MISIKDAAVDDINPRFPPPPFFNMQYIIKCIAQQSKGSNDLDV